MADDLKIKVNGRCGRWPRARTRRSSTCSRTSCTCRGRASAAGSRSAARARCWSTASRSVPASRRSRASPASRVTTLEGLPALVRGAEGAGAGAGAASAAAGLHRRAGAAVRLLLQRHDHQGRGAAGADSAADRSADSRAMNGHLCRCGTYPRIMKAIQRASAPRWRERRDERHAHDTLPALAPRLPQGRRRAGRRLQHAAALRSPAAAARGDAAGPPDPSRSIPGSPFTPTTPRRSISAKASSARATRPACCRSPPRSSTST